MMTKMKNLNGVCNKLYIGVNGDLRKSKKIKYLNYYIIICKYLMCLISS